MIKIMRERTLNAKLNDAKNNGSSAAINEIRQIMQQMDKIEKLCFEPITLVGDHQVIQHCFCLGCNPYGIEVISKGNKVETF